MTQLRNIIITTALSLTVGLISLQSNASDVDIPLDGEWHQFNCHSSMSVTPLTWSSGGLPIWYVVKNFPNDPNERALVNLKLLDNFDVTPPQGLHVTVTATQYNWIDPIRGDWQSTSRPIDVGEMPTWYGYNADFSSMMIWPLFNTSQPGPNKIELSDLRGTGSCWIKSKNSPDVIGSMVIQPDSYMPSAIWFDCRGNNCDSIETPGNSHSVALVQTLTSDRLLIGPQPANCTLSTGSGTSLSHNIDAGININTASAFNANITVSCDKPANFSVKLTDGLGTPPPYPFGLSSSGTASNVCLATSLNNSLIDLSNGGSTTPYNSTSTLAMDLKFQPNNCGSNQAATAGSYYSVLHYDIYYE